ncbi:MAG: hypothetical protein HQL90_04825 [Magnetococcales bacterium]|nr:hypothetical protein [Magnetococcales bacterium]
MPKVEVVKMLMAGEKATIAGPGLVKFEAMAGGLAAPHAVGTAAMAGKAAGAGQMAANGFVVTSATTANSVPASILSGKVLGFSLGSLNPWVLLAMGVVGGYMIAKKKYPKLVW